MNYRFRLLLVALLLLGSISGALLTTGTASAAFDACRGDPVLTLSNGKTMTVTVDIQAAADQVQNVAYVIHIPKNVTVTSMEFPGDALPETVSIYSDAAVSSYQSDVVVTLVPGSSAQVKATTTVVNKSKTATGMDGQHLKALVVVP